MLINNIIENFEILNYNTTSSQRLSNIFVVVSRMVIRFMNTMSA
jgi:hypothetical protein